MQPGELSRKVPRSRQTLLLPQSAGDARREITWLQLVKFAKHLGCERQFEQDQEREDYPAAFLDYHHALWRWVWRLTPPKVIDILNVVNAAHFALPDTPENRANISVGKHDYMLWRAVFVAGMKAGEGFNASHYQHFSRLAHVACRIGDDEVFEIAKQKKWNFKKAKAQAGRVRLKYYLLVSWLAGGLWRMATRAEQMEALEGQWGELPPYSLEAITMAQTGLGLHWPAT